MKLTEIASDDYMFCDDYEVNGSGQITILSMALYSDGEDLLTFCKECQKMYKQDTRITTTHEYVDGGQVVAVLYVAERFGINDSIDDPDGLILINRVG